MRDWIIHVYNKHRTRTEENLYKIKKYEYMDILYTYVYMDNI